MTLFNRHIGLLLREETDNDSYWFLFSKDSEMRHFIIGLALTASLSVAPVYANEAAKPATQATDPDQAIKCRKVEVTGSLVKKGRVCKTIAEWKEIQSNGNRTARMIAESGQVCAGGQCGNGN